MNRRDSFIASSGLSPARARGMYDRLVSAGYKDPGKWHAERYAGLLGKRFIEARAASGVSPSLAKRELVRMQRDGFTPGSWHAKRVKSLERAAFVKQREKMGVSRERANAEADSMLRRGRRIGTFEAERVPIVIDRKYDGFYLTGETLVITSVRQWIDLLERNAEIFWEYEEWITSVLY